MSVRKDQTLKDEQRSEDLKPYKRILPSRQSRSEMRKRGYTWVLSSNVSGVASRGEDLYIRFHNGSVYQYPNQGDKMHQLLDASSKGRWVWDNLRRPNVSYRRVGELPLDEDIDYTDEEIMIPPQMAREVETLVALNLESLQVLDMFVLNF